MARKILIGLLLVIGCVRSEAAVRTNLISGNWDSVLTWTLSAIPSGTDDAYITNGTIVTIPTNYTAVCSNVTATAPSALIVVASGGRLNISNGTCAGAIFAGDSGNSNPTAQATITQVGGTYNFNAFGATTGAVPTVNLTGNVTWVSSATGPHAPLINGPWSNCTLTLNSTMGAGRVWHITGGVVTGGTAGSVQINLSSTLPANQNINNLLQVDPGSSLIGSGSLTVDMPYVSTQDLSLVARNLVGGKSLMNLLFYTGRNGNAGAPTSLLILTNTTLIVSNQFNWTGLNNGNSAGTFTMNGATLQANGINDGQTFINSRIWDMTNSTVIVVPNGGWDDHACTGAVFRMRNSKLIMAGTSGTLRMDAFGSTGTLDFRNSSIIVTNTASTGAFNIQPQSSSTFSNTPIIFDSTAACDASINESVWTITNHATASIGLITPGVRAYELIHNNTGTTDFRSFAHTFTNGILQGAGTLNFNTATITVGNYMVATNANGISAGTSLIVAGLSNVWPDAALTFSNDAARHVDIGKRNSFEPSNSTFDAWVRPRQSGLGRVVASKASSEGWALFLYGNTSGGADNCPSYIAAGYDISSINGTYTPAGTVNSDPAYTNSAGKWLFYDDDNGSYALGASSVNGTENYSSDGPILSNWNVFSGATLAGLMFATTYDAFGFDAAPSYNGHYTQAGTHGVNSYPAYTNSLGSHLYQDTHDGYMVLYSVISTGTYDYASSQIWDGFFQSSGPLPVGEVNAPCMNFGVYYGTSRVDPASSSFIGSVGYLDGNWHHIAGSFTNGTLRAYFDGVLAGTGAGTNATVATTNTWLGDDPTFVGGQPYYGDLDEVRISSVARYPTNFTSPTDNEPDGFTLDLYKFSEGRGTLTYDRGVSNNIGTLSASGMWITPGVGLATDSTGIVTFSNINSIASLQCATPGKRVEFSTNTISLTGSLSTRGSAASNVVLRSLLGDQLSILSLGAKSYLFFTRPYVTFRTNSVDKEAEVWDDTIGGRSNNIGKGSYFPFNQIYWPSP